MMGGCWSVWVVGLVILVTVGSHRVQGSVSCQEVLTALKPCQPFVTGGAPNPSVSCCSGVSKLKDEAATAQDRRDICKCVKSVAPGSGFIPEKAKQLPGLCGVTIPVPIDPNLDCDKIPL